MSEFKCPICEKVFSSDSILEVHQVSAHRSAQDAMNRQQEEIKQSIEEAALCLIKSSVNAGLNHDDEMNALRNSVCSIIKVLAKMNGVEDALK